MEHWSTSTQAPGMSGSSLNIVERFYGPAPIGAPHPLHHHDEYHVTLVPTTYPANAPTVDAISQSYGLERAQELRFDFHGAPCVAPAGTVKGLWVPLQSGCAYSLGALTA
jgi:hypothetical protein